MVATEHHGSGAGLTAIDRAEAELDTREHVFGLLLASADSGAIGSNSTKYIRTYADIVKCKTYIDPLYNAGATNATNDLAMAGVSAQFQRRPAATPPVTKQVPSSTTSASSSEASEASGRPISTYK